MRSQLPATLDGVEAFDALLRETIFLGAVTCFPILLAATLVGTIIAVGQAATQIQEQTITLLPKLVAVGLVIVFGGQFGMGLCAKLFTDALTSIPQIVRAGP